MRRNLLFLLSILIYFNDVFASQNDSIENIDQENRAPVESKDLVDKCQQSQGYFSSLFTRGYYYLTTTTETEQNKFPNIKIETLLSLIDVSDEPAENIIGRFFPYETGSVEGGIDFYRGDAYIESFDYGAVYHQYLGPKKGFSSTVDHRTLKNERTPYAFLNTWIKNRENIELMKGTPYKGTDTKTRLEYTGYNSSATEYVRVLIRREKRDF